MAANVVAIGGGLQPKAGAILPDGFPEMKMVVRGRAVVGGGSVTKGVTGKRMKTCLENKLNNLILSSSFVLYFPKSKYCFPLLWMGKQTSNMLFVSAIQIFL